MSSSGPGPETSFEDLANLGWPKQQIFTTLNDVRDGTMSGADDLHLNDDFCQNWGWYCYNVTKGDLTQQSNPPASISSSDTVWRYDNSQDDQPFTTTWVETWTQSTTASVSVTTAASISLSASFTIPDVGGTSLSVSISSTATTAQTVTDSHQLQNTWSITVGPHEIVEIDRITTTTTQQVIYGQDYGIADGVQGLIGTQGDQWDGHYYWAFAVNDYLLDQSGNPPSGTLYMTGNGQKQSFDHKIIRIPGSNAKQPQATDGVKSLVSVTDVGRKKLRVAISADKE